MPVRKTILIAALILGVIVIPLVIITLWYAWRVNGELGGRPWRNTNQIVTHDGEVLLEFQGNVWRPAQPFTLEELPDEIPLVFLAAEDIRFRSHFGIDPIGVGRAALTNVREGGVTQGGSTITQQLAKTHFFSQERTFRRKALEAIVALLIEARLSKDDILEAYLNDVYLGHQEGRPVLGIDEAARLYFNRSPEKLSLAEAAMLAGMIRAPNRDTAEKRPEVAKRRRNAILQVMLDEEWITAEEFEQASEARVAFRTGSLDSAPHPYPIAAMRTELVDRIGERRLRSGGLIIHTTLDREMQRAAERAVANGVERLRRRHSWLRRSDEPLQAAVLSVNAADGGIRALVGGSNWKTSQFDRTRSMKRQAGSALKPFTYAAAIASKNITPATVIEDSPVRIQLARKDVWSPHNYDERFRGEVTVREAFEKSLNVPAVRIADDVGIRRVKSVLDDAGFDNDFSSTPAIALGVDEVRMIDLAGAYTAFPNLGRRMNPHLVSRVEKKKGREIYKAKTKGRKVMKPAVAYVMHSLMRGVVRRGTAASLGRQGLGYVAGKTGTTNDYRDAWFVGYTSDLVTATWVGFDGGRPLRISSGEAALPVWAGYMSRVKHDKGSIEQPDGVITAKVERATGLLWREGCGSSMEEVFLEGTEPRRRCVPQRHQEPAIEEYEEPTIITLGQLKQWIANAPGVISDVEVIEESLNDATPGSEAGEIRIEYVDEAPEDDMSEEVPGREIEEEPTTSPEIELPPTNPEAPRVLPPSRERKGPPDTPPGQEQRPPNDGSS